MNMSITGKKSRGRPMSFDRSELVETVMHLFWERGYKNLSFNEIAKETGLTRASLYNAFSTKEELLLETITHYSRFSPDNILAEIQEGELVGPYFYTLFGQVSKIRAEDKQLRGCMIINCINELISTGTPLGNTLSNMYDSKQNLIKKLCAQAVRQQELPLGTDAEITANLMITFMSGFSTFSKTGADEAKLRSICYCFLDQLGFSQPDNISPISSINA